MPAPSIDLGHLFPKDPFHQHVIDGLVLQYSKQVGHALTPNDALRLATSLRQGLPQIEAVRGGQYADAIERCVGSLKS